MTMTKTTHLPPRLSGPAKGPAGPASAGPGVAGMTTRDFLRVIQKRKWMMVLICTVCVGLSVAVTAVWYMYFPSYTATALLEVNPPADVMARAQMFPQPILERYKRDQAQLILAKYLPKAIDEQKLRDTTWYQSLIRNQEDPVRELIDAIRVRPIPETSYIELSMVGRNKQELPNIVNTVAATSEKMASADMLGNLAETIEKLKKEQVRKSDEIKSIQSQMSTILGASDVAGMLERRGTSSIELEILTRQVAEGQNLQADAQAVLKAVLDAQQEGTLASSAEVQGALLMNMQYRAMTMRSADLKTSLSNIVRRLGPNHRQVLATEGALESITLEVDELRKQIITDTVQIVIQTRRLEAARAAQTLAEMTARQNLVKSRMRDLERQLGQVEALRKSADMVQTQLDQINTTLLGLEVRVRTSGEGPTERTGNLLVLRNRAGVPREITRPSWSINLALGVCVGLALAFGLAFLLEVADTSIRNPGDIARRVDLPLLGMVPHGDDLDEEVADFRRVMLLEPHSPASEAFRQIRTNLLFSGPAEQRKCLLVTSPTPEDGRTTVVTNLAISVAQAGHRVLIVDANFRQPAIAELFPDAKEAGLSSALVGQANWRDVVSPTGVPNCDVIASGPLPPNPAELFGSKAMEEIIAQMKGEYDQILFDGAPVMVVSDAVVLATKVDAVILVVRAHANSIGIVQRAAGQLRHVGAHILGTVLQGVRTTAGGYLRKNYQTFYEYHQRALP